jgi:hypothetical protein
MAASILLLAFALSAETSPVQVRADLDGQGSVEIATAAASGRRVRLEVRDARGKLLAEAAIPEPGGPEPRVTLTAGSLGSAGTLLEAVAAAPGKTCRTLWRYRDGRLRQIPLAEPRGPLPDCDSDWSSRWEKPAEDSPSEYVRERSRRRPNGLLREVEAFRWAGFHLELDLERSRWEINGVEIPAWRGVTLYSAAALGRLASRFDLSPFRTQPRLEFLADRAEGLFEIRINGTDGEERLPVAAARPGQDKRERMLVAGPGTRIHVLLSSDGDVPLEARVQGDERRPDNLYRALAQQTDEGLRVYDSVERELAEEYLPGAWASEKETFPVTLVSASPPLLRFGNSEVSLTVVRAPEGVDALLLPRDASLPYVGIRLEGPNALSRVPVRCQRAAGAALSRCEAAGPGQTFRRVGARLNVR